MTRPPSSGPGWRWAAPVAFALAGALFASSAATAGGNDLRGGERSRLPDLVRAQDRQVAALAARVAALRADVERRSAVLSGGRPVPGAPAEPLPLAAGLVPLRGAGLVVTLDDAPRPADGRPVPGDPKPDDLVVHQQDLQAVVNAMWRGGADGLQLMDQRVISTSAVRCVGNTLILQGRVYAPPYVVTAVGDPARLRAALDSEPGVAVFREYVEAYGLGLRVETRPSLTLPAFTGSLDLQYARARPRGQ